MQAKKKFGQNFLKDDTVVAKIIQSMSCENALIEIGPGLGDLTTKLLEVTDVKAYEVDNDLSVYLKDKFSDQIDSGSFKLVEQDVLEAWSGGSLEKNDYNIVANLPYYIATAIILLGLKDIKCKSMTVMIQKEVALKFAASKGQKEFCALSVLAQSVADVNVLFDVPPCAFEPAPKVVSSVIKFTKFEKSDKAFCGNEKFENFLKVAFKAPRKTLMKNLSQVYEKEFLKDFFKRFDLPLTIRGHEVDTSTYHNLFKMITKVNDEQSAKKYKQRSASHTKKATSETESKC